MITETGLQHVNTAVLVYQNSVLWVFLLSLWAFMLEFFECPFCSSFRSIWYCVLDVIQAFPLDMGLSQDCQSHRCCVLDRDFALLLGNTTHCVIDQFLGLWPHFACWFSSILNDTFSFRLVKLCKHYSLTQHIYVQSQQVSRQRYCWMSSPCEHVSNMQAWLIRS